MSTYHITFPSLPKDIREIDLLEALHELGWSEEVSYSVLF